MHNYRSLGIVRISFISVQIFSYVHSYLRKFNMTCVLNSIKGLHVLVNNTDIHVYGLYFIFYQNIIIILIFKMKRSIDSIGNHIICYSQP